MNVLDLFSGIGGFSLGLERAGMRTVAFCEIDAYCRAVLRKHWPDVPCYTDVRELTSARLAADGIGVDLIAGGFPCQDISNAGHKAGISGERSGLWRQFSRLIGELRPRFVIVENVSALLGRGLGTVLGDLAAIGFDAEWHCIPASAVGCPQPRDRIWVVAHPEGVRFGPGNTQYRILPPTPACGAGSTGNCGPIHSADCERRVWPSDADLVRVADGFPDRLHRIKALGNSLVPQIPEIIGRAIMRASGEHSAL